MIEQRPRRARSSHFRSVRRILKPLRPILQVARAVLVMSLGYIATFFVPASRNRRVVGWIETRYLDRHSSEVEHLAAKMEAALTSAGEERDWWAEAAVNFRMRLEEGWGRVRIAIYSTPALFVAQQAISAEMARLLEDDGALLQPDEGVVGVRACNDLLEGNLSGTLRIT